jgi:hypothetical protein
MNSMNWVNMFGAEEQGAFGRAPAFFEIYQYSVAPSFTSWTAYTFDVGGSGLVAGTFLAAAGGNCKFSTPFTTTGLETHHDIPDGGMTLMLLGGALVGLEALRRRLRA